MQGNILVNYIWTAFLFLKMSTQILSKKFRKYVPRKSRRYIWADFWNMESVKQSYFSSEISLLFGKNPQLSAH